MTKNTTFCNALWDTITKEIWCISTKYVKSTLNCIFAQICYKYAKWFQHEIKTGYLTTRQRHHVTHVSKHTQIAECRENHHSHATMNNFIYCLAHTCTSSVFLFTNTIWHIIVNSCICKFITHSTFSLNRLRWSYFGFLVSIITRLVTNINITGARYSNSRCLQQKFIYTLLHENHTSFRYFCRTLSLAKNSNSDWIQAGWKSIAFLICADSNNRL